jgi:hypothetical protein
VFVHRLCRCHAGGLPYSSLLLPPTHSVPSSIAIRSQSAPFTASHSQCPFLRLSDFPQRGVSIAECDSGTLPTIAPGIRLVRVVRVLSELVPAERQLFLFVCDSRRSPFFVLVFFILPLSPLPNASSLLWDCFGLPVASPWSSASDRLRRGVPLIE